MKILFLFFLFFLFSLFTQRIHAVTWEIHDPCQNRILYKGNFNINYPYPNLGQFSVDRFLQFKIPFVGTEKGIGSILNTPQGESSLVVVSTQEMFAYGWCFHHNGIEPAVMPHDVFFKNNSDHIKWFYAYTAFENGQWQTMCAPAYEKPLKSYCK